MRYRKQRRWLVREIILHQFVGEIMEEYITFHTPQLVEDENDRVAFQQNVHEDLQHLDEAYLAAIGVTEEQMNAWLKIFRK